jgi:alpha-amylase
MSDLNGTMMQYFHWYLPSDGNFWDAVKDKAEELAAAGITALWLPPAYKASGGSFDVGYGAYDLFDLGEFDQKGSIRTKYGTKEQYLAAVNAAKQAGLSIYADAVFNHKNGGDAEEEIQAYPVAGDNRSYGIGGIETIKSYTAYYFPGRGDKYSSLKWHWWHFDGVNHNMFKPGDGTIYCFKDKRFDSFVDLQLGNYDFLMGCDLDIDNSEVRNDLKLWGEWTLDTVGVDGFRLDAIKHISSDFFAVWVDHVENYAKRNLFIVGEYWTESINALHWYISNTDGRIALFDAPLHYNFSRASKAGEAYDMRLILKGSLMQEQPALAVTIVENHDTQPLQALESVVEPWFKPLAYALILLRREGYPCIFYADYYGAHYVDKGRDGNEYEIFMPCHRFLIDKFLYARQHYAYGDQYDYFDHSSTIGWTRLGNEEHPKTLAVLLTNGSSGSKWMETGAPNATYYDITEHIAEPVTTNEYGWGEFYCNGGSVSVWVEK